MSRNRRRTDIRRRGGGSGSRRSRRRHAPGVHQRARGRVQKGFEQWYYPFAGDGDGGGYYHQNFDKPTSVWLARLNRPYIQNPHVFMAVNKIINSLKGVPIKLTRGRRGGDDVVEDGPAFDLIQRPWPGGTWVHLIERTLVLAITTGTAFWIKVESDTLGRTKRLIVESPLRMKPQKGSDGEVVSWTRTLKQGRREIYLASDVIALPLNFNPYEQDEWKGLSPILPAMADIRNDQAMSEFTEASFTNHAAVDTAVSLAGYLTEPQRKVLNDDLMERHSGTANAKRPLILEGGGKVERLSQTPAEMDFVGSRDVSLRIIGHTIGTPYEKMGGRAKSSRNISHEATLDFWDLTVIPIGKWLCNALRMHILQPLDPDIWIWFDFKQVSALMERHVHLVLQALKLAEMGYPINDINQWLEFGLPDQPWGNEWWVNAGKLPASALMEEARSHADNGLREGEEEKVLSSQCSVLSAQRSALSTEHLVLVRAGERTKRAIYRKWDATLRPLETRLRRSARRFLESQARRIARKLRELGANKDIQGWQAHQETTDPAGLRRCCDEFDERFVAGDATCVETFERIRSWPLAIKTPEIIDWVFDVIEENKKLTAALRPHIKDSTELGARQAVGELFRDTAPKERAEKLRSVLSDPKIRQAMQTQLTEIPEMVNTVTRARVQAAITEGLEAGETLSGIAERIAQELPGGFRRASTIARTEVGSAVRTGLHTGYERLVPEAKKKWLSARDENVRDAHREADARYDKSPIGMKQHFEVDGDRMLYPGGPGASPKNKINERCRHVAVIQRKSRRGLLDVTWKYYAGLEFVTVEQMDIERHAERERERQVV